MDCLRIPRWCSCLFSRLHLIICSLLLSSLQVINDEDGGILKKYGHSTVHDANQFRNSTGLPTLATSHSTTSSRVSNSLNGLPTASMNGYNTNPASRSASGILQRKSSEGAPERSLQSVLQASQQQVNAIETMLKGVAVDDLGSYYSNPQTTGNRSSQLKTSLTHCVCSQDVCYPHYTLRGFPLVSSSIKFSFLVVMAVHSFNEFFT